MIRELRYILTVLIGVSMMVSCADEPIIQGSGDIPKGYAKVSAKVSFKPFGSALNGGSRTAGDAIKEINSLYVVIFNVDGTFFQSFDATSQENGYTVEPEERNNTNVQVGADEHIAEAATPCATFNKTIPYGRYKIYVVANHKLDLNKQYTIEELRSIKLTWNSDDVSANNQMFGYFTGEKTNVKPSGWEAPEITIASPTVDLHAWIRRAASKVTVAYDGTNLNENVYIYIHSVQIKDIPNTCLLGQINKPTDKAQLLSDGEIINYRNEEQSSQNAAGIVIAKGSPRGGSDHSETADALFFYENMQEQTTAIKGKFQDELGNSTVTHPDGDNPNDEDHKDGISCGSYIEVKGYYINKIADRPSQGIITYRFMLGKDVERDCNAERNYHYKLTLKFKNDANNPDWHIVYKPDNPTVSIPKTLYISYGYNESVTIPVVVNAAFVDDNTTIKAEITHNPWGYPEHKYYNKSNHEGLEDGFLIFAPPESAPVKIEEDDRNNDWIKDGYGAWNAVRPTSVDGTVAHYDIPVYTRPLILGNSLTGHNPYVSYPRKAKIKITVNGQDLYEEIEIIQVKRLVNPTGVWRSDNNINSFNVRLMDLNVPDTNETGMVSTDFIALRSDGPWTAHIEKGADWVEIAKTNTGLWGTSDVSGETNSEIRFDYKPKNVNNTGKVRCGVIKITYHNNNCVHYVFVSQGNGTINIKGTNWQNRNVLRKNELVANPLLEGSMFKFGNPDDAILAEIHHATNYGFNIDRWGQYFFINDRSQLSYTFESLGYDLNGFVEYTDAEGTSCDKRIFTNSNVRPASYDEWLALEDLHRRYGVMYGDECNETMTTTPDAYTYYAENQSKGMQGMFVWDRTRDDGNHLFFPIGSTGYGHMKVHDNTYTTTNKYSLLKYAQRAEEMTETDAKSLPMYYDLWMRKGAIYWYDKHTTVGETKCYSHDINYHTMLLQSFTSNGIGQYDKYGNLSTDAGFIRCVEP